MIAHVAEASEARGRVVLRVGGGPPSDVAIEAAIRVAQAFNSSVESLLVEDTDLIELASYPFAREVSFTGRRRREIDAKAMRRDLQLAAQAVRRRIEAMARGLDVPVVCRTVQDRPLHAVAAACAQSGPWNVVALAEPIGAGNLPQLGELLTEVEDSTGLVVVGPRASRTSGPIVLVVEEAGRLGAMLPAAERLAALAKCDIVVLLVGDDEEQVALIEAQVRLMLADRCDVRLAFAAMARGESAAVAEAIRLLAAGFVLAQFGGIAVPSEGSLAPLAAALECPLFLVR